MATYFKYAERSADSQVNWAEIGKNMTDMLKEETRIREEKKAAIDEASRQFGETLANAPQGEDASLNTWALEYGNNASQYMLMQDRLLKSGQMKLKDYTVGRQNLLDGTNGAFNLIKEFQAEFSDKMERYKKGESQDLEQWLMARAEKFGDFTKSQLYINPTDGKVNVAMKELKNINGKDVYVMTNNPTEFTTVNALRNQIKGKYDKFDSNAVTDAFVASLGEEVKNTILQNPSLTQGGMILTVEDIRSRKDLSEDGKQVLYKFIDSENQFINGALANPYNRLSLLTNSKKFAPNGKQYTFTYDENEAKNNPEMILLKQDSRSGQPTPVFSEEQMKVSQDFMRTELRPKYTKKSDIKTTPQTQLQERRAKTPYEIEAETKKDTAKNIAQNLVYALTGDPNQASKGTKYLSGVTGMPFTRTPQGFVVYNPELKANQTYKFREDGKLQDPRGFVKSFIGPVSRNLGVNEDDVLQYFSQFLPKGAIINEKTSATGFDAKPKPADPITVFGNDVKTKVNSINFKGLSNSDAAEQINNSVSAFGFTAKTPWFGTNRSRKVYLVNKYGKESPEFDMSSPKFKQALSDWMKANLGGNTREQSKQIEQMIKSGVINTPVGGKGELD